MVRDAFVIVAPLQLGPGVLVRIIAAGAPQSGAGNTHGLCLLMIAVHAKYQVIFLCV